MSKTTSKFMGCVLATAIAAFAAPSLAATVCVNPSSASCAATIQAGVTAALAGDTVSIKAGFYNENVTVPTGKDGLTIKGSKSTVLDPDAPLAGDGLTINSDGVTVSGLTIRNGQGIGIVSNGDGALIKGVTITGPDDACIEINGDDSTVASSTLNGCGDHAVDIFGDDADIVGNKISHCGNDCIEVNGDAAIIEKNSVRLANGGAADVNTDGVELIKNKISVVDGDGFDVSGDNVLVDGNKISVTHGYGVDVTGINPVVTKNRTRYSYGNEGIEVDCNTDCTSSLVAGNRVEDVFDDAGGVFVTATVAGMIVEKNSVSRVEDNAYDVDGAGAILFRNNKSKTNGGDADDEHCLLLDGTGHQILDNRFEDCHGDGINATGTGHLIEGNDFRNLIEGGIVVDGTSTLITVDDNKVTNANGAALQFESSVTNSTADGNKLKRVRMGLCNVSASTTVTNSSVSKADTPDQTAGTCPSW